MVVLVAIAWPCSSCAGSRPHSKIRRRCHLGRVLQWLGIHPRGLKGWEQCTPQSLAVVMEIMKCVMIFASLLLITSYTNQSVALTSGHLNPPVSGTGGGVGGVGGIDSVGKGVAGVSVGGFVGLTEVGGLVSGGAYGLPVGAVAVVGSNGMSNNVVSEISIQLP